MKCLSRLDNLGVQARSIRLAKHFEDIFSFPKKIKKLKDFQPVRCKTKKKCHWTFANDNCFLIRNGKKTSLLKKQSFDYSRQ